ncbi:MAG: radical SAM protein [Peptococcaceae bacterium BICA1-7]|nr:MAG: radical SAM protein [Peptococcaceae bacterium BICA1-7]HBV98036.1 B12-binding domain-containing radical SAM protein [Desulfotomaculum sp.]
MLTLLMITPENKEINRFRVKQYNNFTQLTMPYLAGFVPAEFKITLIDEYSQAVPFEKFDLVAITVNTPNAPHVYQMAHKFRKLGAWVVIGGPHVTLLPEEASVYADTIFVGEAEETWPEFLRHFLDGKQERLYRCDYPPDLIGLPIPRRDLIAGHRFTSGSVFASRGCPYNCSYCCLKNIYHQQFRTRPVNEVIEDIKNIPNKHFVFWDDNFFADAEYTKKLLCSMQSLNRKWAAQVNAHSCKDKELLSLAQNSGCIYLFLGLESFSASSLKDANKEFNQVEQYADIVKLLHSFGISVQAGIVFGFDSDTADIFSHTLKHCESIGVDGVTASILTPYPGTELYIKYKKEGRLLSVDWSHFNGKTRVSFQPNHFTPQQLLDGYHQFRGSFYSWKNIINRLSKSRVNIIYNLLINIGYRQSFNKFFSGQ